MTKQQKEILIEKEKILLEKERKEAERKEKQKYWHKLALKDKLKQKEEIFLGKAPKAYKIDEDNVSSEEEIRDE